MRIQPTYPGIYIRKGASGVRTINCVFTREVDLPGFHDLDPGLPTP